MTIPENLYILPKDSIMTIHKSYVVKFLGRWKNWKSTIIWTDYTIGKSV